MAPQGQLPRGRGAPGPVGVTRCGLRNARNNTPGSISRAMATKRCPPHRHADLDISEAQHQGATEDFLVTREFGRHATRDQKLDIERGAAPAGSRQPELDRPVAQPAPDLREQLGVVGDRLQRDREPDRAGDVEVHEHRRVARPLADQRPEGA